MNDFFIRFRRHLAENRKLWQHKLLSPHQLWQMAKNKGINLPLDRGIEKLWSSGLLKADIVTSSREINEYSLSLLERLEDGTYVYCDTREVQLREENYGSIFSEVAPIADDIRLFFHPFRLYVLYHIDRVFDPPISTTQYLQYSEGFQTVTEHIKGHLDRWTASQGFCDRFERWNQTSELAICLEPCSYTKIYKQIHWHFGTIEETQSQLRIYSSILIPELQKLNLEHLEALRRDLCNSAEILDGNKTLHVLLRLTTWHGKKELKGDIGAAMLFLAMAEVIRRAAEKAFKTELPEEDELGFGQWMPNARKTLYGSERVLDAPRTDIRDFFTEVGIDSGTKIRCYVEGETELGALRYALSDISGVEFINLRGQVLESKSKGVTFRDALKNDLQSKVFSVVLIDKDREDHVRALRKAAEEDLICGQFCISEPDFEFSNFSAEELVEIILKIAADNKLVLSTDLLTESLGSVSSSKEFFKVLYNLYPETRILFGKSEAWGEALMYHALGGEKERPMIEVARTILQCKQVKYGISRERMKVDPTTGIPVKREVAS